MSFYREQIISNPRKNYVCYACGKIIIGKHLYIAGISSIGDFCTMRIHIGCSEKAKEMCSVCEYSFDCQYDIGECFREKCNKR